VVVCRSESNTLDHRHHTPVFSAALEGNDDSQGIAKDSTKVGKRDEPGEPVDVQESLEFCHPEIVPEFFSEGKTVIPRKQGASAERAEIVTH
jgi:hypothetical protein